MRAKFGFIHQKSFSNDKTLPINYTTHMCNYLLSLLMVIEMFEMGEMARQRDNNGDGGGGGGGECVPYKLYHSANGTFEIEKVMIFHLHSLSLLVSPCFSRAWQRRLYWWGVSSVGDKRRDKRREKKRGWERNDTFEPFEPLLGWLITLKCLFIEETLRVELNYKLSV